MTSRGIWWYMSARTRKSLTLFWTALFVCSLLMQYASFAAAPPVAAVHDEGIFELDGNALDQATPGDDWQNGTPGAADTLFIPGAVEKDGADVTYFKGGGSKDHHDIPDWEYSATDVAPDKDELLDVFAAVYEDPDGTIVYFGADKFDDSGDAQIGFWFFQDTISLGAGGAFNGEHTVGDVLILSDFTNGGNVDTICVYEWDPSQSGDTAPGVPDVGCDTGDNLLLSAAGTSCDVGDGSFDVCAVVNDGPADVAPWPFLNKDGATTFGAGQFFEGGINLSELFGGDAPCFGTFLAETRSSQEVEAQLKDFALGSLDTCVPPDITTESSVSTADFGQQVTDTATLSGAHGPVTGTVQFLICPPADVTAVGCAAGDGTAVGSPVTIVAGSATSPAYTVGLTAAAVGTYCWRAEYTPDANSEYLAGAHTDHEDECFTVAPATIEITKVAVPVGPVDAGAEIGFDITVTNTGTGTALGVNVNDPLPAGIVWTADAPTGDTTGVSCSINTAPSPDVLTCTDASMASGDSFTVHIHGMTDAADCGTINNTANVTTTNDGSDSASASVEVRCAVIDVTKTADAPSVNAGEQIGFTVTLSNTGAGTATGLVFTDPLPAGPGISWSIDPASAGWSITGAVGSQMLVYSPTTLAGGASTSVHVVSNTTAASCGVYNNTATVTTGNDGQDSASASTEVLCADIDVEKTADAPSVNAGEQIGFTVTLSNSGEGDATGLAFTDALPAGPGINWSIDPASAGWSITGAVGSQQLVYAPTTLAAGASTSVHVVSNTTADSCGVYDNTASVTTGNDGSDTDSATTEVLCADIDVEKEADAATVNAGDQIGFTVTLSNSGEGDATGLAFTDALPAGPGISWSIDPASAGWSITGAVGSQMLVYAPTTLAAGASTSVHVVSATTAASCGVYDNTASVTTGNDGSDSDSASTEVLCGEINVEKIADDASVNAGEQIGFTVTLTNSGDGLVTGLAFTDALPGGPGISWSIDPASAGWSITGTAPNQSLVYAPTTLAAGASTSVHVVSDTTAQSCGVYDNTASVTTGNDGSDTASDSTEVLCAEIGIEKVADADEVIAGEQIGFTVTLSNSGEGDATGLAFTDALPGGPGISWSIDPASAGWSITGTAPNQNLVYTPTTLAAGASTSVHVVSNTTFDSCGVYDNTASVTSANDGSGEASDSTAVRCPDIDIDKTSDDDDGIVGKGQTVTFTINVTVAEGPVSDAVLTDVLPVGQTYVDGSQDSTPAATNFEVSADGRTLTWTWDSLDNDGAVVTYDVTIDEDAAIGDQTNVAEICVSEVPNCEDDDETVTVPDLTIVKSFTGNTGGVFESEDPNSPLNGTPVANIGDILTYTLTYDLTNGPVHNGVITDTLPVGLAYVTGSATDNAEFTFQSFDPATRTLTWTAPLVSADGSVTYQVRVLEGSADLPQPLVNVATIDSDETPPDEDQRQVLVAEPPLAITPPPTLPPTSTIDDPSQGTSNPGFSLMLVLLGLAGFTLAVGFITPVPERVRRQDRRG